MKRHGLRTAACVLLVGTVLAAFVAIAADVGSQGDPLVTLSYLNETFLGQLLDKVDEKLAARDEALRRELAEELGQGGIIAPDGGTSAGYIEVTLEAGETLWGSAGTEILFRGGSAVCMADGAPGLVDATDGGSIGNGDALKKDHLYAMTTDRGVAASNQVTLLVRGQYTIG